MQLFSGGKVVLEVSHNETLLKPKTTQHIQQVFSFTCLEGEISLYEAHSDKTYLSPSKYQIPNTKYNISSTFPNYGKKAQKYPAECGTKEISKRVV